MRVVAGIVAALVGGPMALRAQQAPPSAVAALPPGLDSAARAALAPVFARAVQQGLPVMALRVKAAEGVLHGVPSDRIVGVVTRFAERLVVAKAALAPAQPDEVSDGANALGLGVSASVLRDIRKRRPATPVTIPLAVLVQLVTQGIPASRAGDIVLRLLERGASTQQLAELPKVIDRDVASGVSAERALDLRAANVLATLGPRPLPALPTAAAAAAPSMPVGVSNGNHSGGRP